MFFSLCNFCSAFTTLPYIIQTTIKFTFNKPTSLDLICWHRKDGGSDRLLRLVLEPLELGVGIGESVQPEPNRVGGMRLGERRGGTPSIPHLRIFVWYLGLQDFETPMGSDSKPKLCWPDLPSADHPTEENTNSFLPSSPQTSQQKKIPSPSISLMDEKTSFTCFHTQYLICPS